MTHQRGSPLDIRPSWANLLYTPTILYVVSVSFAALASITISPNSYLGSTSSTIDSLPSLQASLPFYFSTITGSLFTFICLYSNSTSTSYNSTITPNSYLTFTALILTILTMLFDNSSYPSSISLTVLLPNLLAIAILLTTLNSSLFNDNKVLPFLALASWHGYNSYITSSTPTSNATLNCTFLLFLVSSVVKSSSFSSIKKLSSGNSIVTTARHSPLFPMAVISASAVLFFFSIVDLALGDGNSNSNSNVNSAWCAILSSSTSFLTVLFLHSVNHRHGGFNTSSGPSTTTPTPYTLGMVLPTVLLILQNSPKLLNLALGFLLGSCSGLFLAAGVAFCVEQWYPVGSPQFQMVAWDSLMLVVYFIAPACVLGNRVHIMYGEEIIGSCRTKGLGGGEGEEVSERASELITGH